MGELRPYQQAMLDAVRQAYRDGARRPCLVLPCGGGKSVIAAEMARLTTPARQARALSRPPAGTVRPDPAYVCGLGRRDAPVRRDDGADRRQTSGRYGNKSRPGRRTVAFGMLPYRHRQPRRITRRLSRPWTHHHGRKPPLSRRLLPPHLRRLSGRAVRRRNGHAAAFVGRRAG